jgi:hypothetical protein
MMKSGSRGGSRFGQHATISYENMRPDFGVAFNLFQISSKTVGLVAAGRTRLLTPQSSYNSIREMTVSPLAIRLVTSVLSTYQAFPAPNLRYRMSYCFMQKYFEFAWLDNNQTFSQDFDYHHDQNRRSLSQRRARWEAFESKASH